MAFQTNFKEPKGSAKVARALRREKRKAAEDRNKADVRRRDKRCRFPLCGCRRFNLALHVSHAEHKGMGGNPAADRSDASLMVYVDVLRHKEGRIAIDRGTLRWRPLTAKGANGPIAWELDGEALQPIGHTVPGPVAVFLPQGWVEIARETAVQVLAPLEEWQRTLLKYLAGMTV